MPFWGALGGFKVLVHHHQPQARWVQAASASVPAAAQAWGGSSSPGARQEGHIALPWSPISQIGAKLHGCSALGTLERAPCSAGLGGS